MAVLARNTQLAMRATVLQCPRLRVLARKHPQM
jgi:hypothetical protein